jgi:hypothetical protein
MRHRFLSLAVLAGIALALLAPAGPASAEQCQREIEPSPDCPPPPPPPDPGMSMAPGGSGQVPMPTPPPTMPADPVGAICLNAAEGSPIFASDSRDSVYTFVVGVRYCVNPNTGLIVSVTPVVPTPIRTTDERVSVFSGPLEKNLTRVPAGGSVTEAIVIYELDVNFFPFGRTSSVTQSYNHQVGLRITTRPLRVQEPPVRPVFELTRVSR